MQLAWARDELLNHRPAETPVILATNLGRDGEAVRVVPLGKLNVDDVDMLTVVVVGSSDSRTVATGDGKTWVYTPRGYSGKAGTQMEKSGTVGDSIELDVNVATQTPKGFLFIVDADALSRQRLHWDGTTYSVVIESRNRRIVETASLLSERVRDTGGEFFTNHYVLLQGEHDYRGTQRLAISLHSGVQT
jgi:hypothetical protein